jgi:hypothetical protein
VGLVGIQGAMVDQYREETPNPFCPVDFVHPCP